MKQHLFLIALIALMTGPALAADDKEETKRLPIDGDWIVTATRDGKSEEGRAYIKGGKLVVPGAPIHWKNIRQVPGTTARYSAVQVYPGTFYGTREVDVEFWLDADGVLRHDDSKVWWGHRLVSKITLRRK